MRKEPGFVASAAVRAMYFSIISSPRTVHTFPRGCAFRDVIASIFLAIDTSVGETI